MGPELEKAVHGISLRMRLLRTKQEEQSLSDLTERETFILELLGQRGRMTVSQIAEDEPTVSESTISTMLTKLWRTKKMVSKTINPQNQRSTIIELTDKGRKSLEIVKQQRTERFQALFNAIQVTDEEEKVLIRILNRAIEFFDKHLGLDKSIAK